MSFSANCKVAIVCAALLLFLHARQKNGTNDTFIFRGVDPPCCVETSAAPIKEAAQACYEQREYAVYNCEVHAFIFVTVSNNTFCVDPKASWLLKRLEKLAAVSVNIDV
uniref:Chemokine interleukin-8-like domain-containing protein n=1 Tax=Poecilia reticulata TaxID=8081 RepID=A0A3P9QCQ8_POERE